MPSKSKAQANLMRAAEHGAKFPMAKKIRASMAPASLHDFAATKSATMPAHVKRIMAPRPGGNRYKQIGRGK